MNDALDDVTYIYIYIYIYIHSWTGDASCDIISISKFEIKI